MAGLAIGGQEQCGPIDDKTGGQPRHQPCLYPWPIAEQTNQRDGHLQQANDQEHDAKGNPKNRVRELQNTGVAADADKLGRRRCQQQRPRGNDEFAKYFEIHPSFLAHLHQLKNLSGN